jgi:hypothetical protein
MQMTKTQTTLTSSLLDAVANEILSATNLYNLLHELKKFYKTCQKNEDEDGYPNPLDCEDELRWRGIDLCELPTFGGTTPRSTEDAWSWDEDSKLIGNCIDDFEIVDRPLRPHKQTVARLGRA